MRRFKVLIFLLFSLFQGILNAQQITGKVVDENKEEAIPSSNIVINPGNYGTFTNSKGEFKFEKLPAGKYKLVISVVGFKTRNIDIEVKDNDSLDLTIKLQPDNKKIDEVLILGNYRQLEIIKHPEREPVSLMPSISSVSKSHGFWVAYLNFLRVAKSNSCHSY